MEEGTGSEETLMDEWRVVDAAIQVTRQLVSGLPGYADLASFGTMLYTDEELAELGEPDSVWVGQYSKGSALSERGVFILINISKHPTMRDMVGTLLHELGHAIWDLIDEDTRRIWVTHPSVNADLEGHRLYSKDFDWGMEELFADNFMYLAQGDFQLMTDKDLFNGLASS